MYLYQHFEITIYVFWYFSLKFVLSVFAFVLPIICQSVDENCDECGAWRAPWHSGTAGSCNNCHGGIENLFLEINIHILPSSSCVVTMVYINIYIWCIFIVFHKPYLLTCDILSTPIPIQLLRGPSEQPELEWCSLKPQNLRVLSQLQSC